MPEGYDKPRAAPQRPVPPQQHEGISGRGQDAEKGSTTRDRSRRPAAPVKPAEGKQLPYLNVITNFSKPNTSTVTASAPKPGHRRNESLHERRRNGRLNGGSKGRVGSIKAEAEEPQSGLSPSDGELMIGFSIPGPPVAPPRQPPTKSPKLSAASPNPEIVITPAVTGSPMSSPPSARRRAASSIYSRAPTGVKMLDSSPPVPPISRYSVATSIETSSRCTSWASNFSEEDTLHHSRSESRERLMVTRTDTVATKHRSHGWWNQILSPFLDPPERPKELREEKDYHTHVPDGNWKIAKNPVQRPPRMDSIWADLTSHSIAKQADEFYPAALKSISRVDYHGKEADSEDYKDLEAIESDRGLEDSPYGTAFLGQPSPAVFQVQGMGSAAEYFEASWHDQNSSTPYFKCENHVCSYGRGNMDQNVGLTPIVGHEQTNGTGSRGLMDGSGEPSVKQSPASDLPLKDKAGSSHRRQASDATIIEDEATPALGDGNKGAGASESSAKDSRNLELRSRPLPPPPPEEDAESPDAMTPGLRSDYADKKALPMRPSKTRMQPDEPQPRYPLHGDYEEMPEPLMPPSNAAAKPHDFGSGGKRGDNHEINDSHPVVSFPPHPPRSDSKQFPTGYPPPRSTSFTPPPPPPDTRSVPSRPPRSDSMSFPPPPSRHESPSFPPASSRHNSNLEAKDKSTDKVDPKVKSSKRLCSVFGSKAAHGEKNGDEKAKKKRRRVFCGIFTCLLLMVVVIVVLVIVLTLPRADMSVQTSWLNVSGYPPVPTGISTIIQPKVQGVDGCIQPPTMWSCAIPKDDQQSTTSAQANFRVEIRFQNGTNLTSNSTFSKRHDSKPGKLGLRLMHHKALELRDTFTTGLFTSNPAPPSSEDQAFLGNTTEKNHEPFNGEPTPFFMSFLDARQVDNSARRLVKRQSSMIASNSTNSTNPFPNISNAIPPPSINADGTASPANLYPFPVAQPLMLYNRGLPNEHYGFYTYFERSIFLKSASVDNITTIGVVPDDQNGGSTEAEASLRCSWAQTRFLVQIWTNFQPSATLVSGANSTSAADGSGSASASATQPASSSSANNFTAPGSFPYPISITLDRHGGDINTKSVYCYGLDDRSRIIMDAKKFQRENRAYLGKLANPALGLLDHVNVSIADGGPGGIDGGTGGCSCIWRNFKDT